MPLYEGLSSFGTEKNSVILDIGASLTKCGFSGENSPRCIIPTQVRRRKNGQMVKVFNCGHFETEEFRGVMVDFLHMLYFRHLLVNPKERRVVVCESSLNSTKLRDVLANVLFNNFEVQSVVFVPSHLMAVFTMGLPSALVIDLGYTETHVIPVYQGISVLNAWEALPLTSKALHSNLESLLKENSTIRSTDGEEVPYRQGQLPEEILEEIKVQCCFVTQISRAKLLQAAKWQNISESQVPSAPPSVDYPLDGDRVLHIDGRVRECCCEVLFELDNDEQSVATMILDSIVKCPMDIRRTMAENIIVVGGTAMLPGFKHRLSMELSNLLNTPKYTNRLSVKEFKFHALPAKENYVSWLGAAIFGSLDVLAMRSTSREEYKKNGNIPDWNVITDNEEDEKVDVRKP